MILFCLDRKYFTRLVLNILKDGISITDVSKEFQSWVTWNFLKDLSLEVRQRGT